MQKKDFSEDFIIEIKKQGLPVIGNFDYMDSTALIHVKEDGSVFVGYAYGEECIRPNTKKPYSLKDITEEGLFHIHHDGTRPGDKYWDEEIEGAKEDEAESKEDEDQEE